MEWELRIILAIIGAAIIGVVAFDGWRRSQKGKVKVKLGRTRMPKSSESDSRDREGFDMDGVGEVRKVVRERQQDEEPELVMEEPLVASRDESISLRETESISAREVEEDPNAEPELIFSLALIASDEQVFDGSKLLQLLIENGCRFGDMDIFHRHRTAHSKQKYFSVANAFNPGVFNLDEMPGESFRGITFFMAIPGAFDPETAYEAMVVTARNLHKELGGKLIDSRRSVFTEQTHQHELEQIKDYKRRSLTRA